MKRSPKSMEWILGATAALFLIFGEFIAPHYEALFAAADPASEVSPIGKYCLWFAWFLIVVLALRIIYRWKNR